MWKNWFVINLNHLISVYLRKSFYYVLSQDGVITDLQETKEALVKASDLPLSILIVGVGGADFKEMEVSHICVAISLRLCLDHGSVQRVTPKTKEKDKKIMKEKGFSLPFPLINLPSYPRSKMQPKWCLIVYAYDLSSFVVTFSIWIFSIHYNFNFEFTTILPLLCRF